MEIAGPEMGGGIGAPYWGIGQCTDRRPDADRLTPSMP